MRIRKSLIAVLTVLHLSAWCFAEEPAAEAKAPLKKMSATETAAVEKFKTEMGAVKTWFTAYLESCAEKEALSHQIPINVSKKLSTVHTEGLPKDLSDAFTSVSSEFKKQAELLKDMPKDDAAIMDWMAKKLEDEKFADANGALMEAQSTACQDLIKVAATYGAASAVDLYDMGETADQIVDRWVVILGSHKTFEEAKKQAEDLAKKSKVPFTMNGMVFDAEGLHYPKDFEDEVYAGQYVARRGNAATLGEKEVENFLSVEKSDDYKDFAPGLYIIVGNIADTAEEGAKQVETFKKVAPDAYAKVTKIFIGCDR